MAKETLIRAVELAGGQSQLARAIRPLIPGSKVGQEHVWKWLNKAESEVPPAEYVLPIAQALNWQITPHQLRPDLYPNPTDALPEQQAA
jgi:DNA-binding transcriptional regulator YdaS (Cro superfamily)